MNHTTRSIALGSAALLAAAAVSTTAVPSAVADGRDEHEHQERRENDRPRGGEGHHDRGENRREGREHGGDSDRDRRGAGGYYYGRGGGPRGYGYDPYRSRPYGWDQNYGAPRQYYDGQPGYYGEPGYGPPAYGPGIRIPGSGINVQLNPR